MTWLTGGFGALTALLLAVGADSIGGLFAFFQLGFLVGAPLAIVLHRQLRSWTMVVVFAVPFSIALSAISVQFLIWFRVASGSLLVVTATAYGIVLALLLAADRGSDPLADGAVGGGQGSGLSGGSTAPAAAFGTADPLPKPPVRRDPTDRPDDATGTPGTAATDGPGRSTGDAWGGRTS